MSGRVGWRNWQKPDESHAALMSCDSWDAWANCSGGRPGFTIRPAVWSAPMGLVQ